MYTISDIPAFEKLILANASLLYRESYGASILKAGQTRQLTVVISATKDGKYAANLVDLTQGKIIETSSPDGNPAFAVLNLFNDTAAAVTKAFSHDVPQGEDPDAPKDKKEEKK